MFSRAAIGYIFSRACYWSATFSRFISDWFTLLFAAVVDQSTIVLVLILTPFIFIALSSTDAVQSVPLFLKGRSCLEIVVSILNKRTIFDPLVSNFIFFPSRVLTALCRHKQDLGCARAICYDIIRFFYGFQNAALELVVAMVTVWPEVLERSSDCLPTEQPPLVRTLKLVLLNWAKNSPIADIGNILRALCSWGDDSVTEEELKDHGSQLIKGLHEEGVASISIDKGRTRDCADYL